MTLLERIRDAEAQAVRLAEEAGLAKKNKTRDPAEFTTAINDSLYRMHNLTHRLLNPKSKNNDDANN